MRVGKKSNEPSGFSCLRLEGQKIKDRRDDSGYKLILHHIRFAGHYT